MKVSIITITYNSEKTIEDTINSVISQDYPEIEYLIVDGKSRDDTLKIIEKYRNKIAKVISEPDRGICDAFNKGIRESTGDVIGIINSDDMLLPGAISHLVSVIKPTTDVLYGNGKRLFEDGTLAPYCAGDHRKLIYQMTLVHPATFVRRAAYERYGYFDLQYKGCMDRELLLRMYKNGAIFQKDQFDYAIYRMGGFSDQNFRTVIAKEREEISMKYGQSRFAVKLHSAIARVAFWIIRIVRGK